MAEIGDLWRCGCGETWIEDGEGAQELPVECGRCGLDMVHLGPQAPASEHPAAQHCPTCGSPVKLHSGDEGTNSYEPVVQPDHRIRDEIAWLSAHGHHERAEVLAGWIGVRLERDQPEKGEG